MLSAGSSAPNFSGANILGTDTFTLSDHAGQVLCLALSAYWCPHCTNELTRLQSLWTRYQGHGVQMVAVHTDPNQAAAVTWLNGMGITFPVVQDDAWGTIMNSYATGTTGIPQLYVIARGQVIHSSHLGADPEPTIEGYLLDAIYERSPVDLELVMDVSGSMNSTVGGADSKLTMMRQAARMVVDFLRDHGQTEDRAGLVWFTDNASEYVSAWGGSLRPVISSADELKGQIDAHGTGICTAIGAGLQTAFDALSTSTHARDCILLTDGMQNIEPKVALVGDHYEIIDSGGWLCGAHSTTAARPGVNIASYNTRVHTIGVGVAATYASLLEDLANATGGSYLGTEDPSSDLDLIYFVDLCNCMAGGSPAVLHHHAGSLIARECRAIERFHVNRTVRKLTAILSWEEALGGSLAFWLRAPDGTLLDLHRAMKLHGTYAMATVYLPAERRGKRLPHVGEWEMIIGGEAGAASADYRALIVAEDGETRFTFDHPRKPYAVGDLVPLRVRLEEKKRRLQPAELLLTQTTLRVPIAELLARYKPALHHGGPGGLEPKPPVRALERWLDLLAQDPRLKEQLMPMRRTSSLRQGTLSCRFTDEGAVLPVSLAQPGLHTFRMTAHYDCAERGLISRVGLVSVQVGPGKADPKSSQVSCVPVTAGRRRGADLYVTPRNASGHLLGPGLAGQFAAQRGREGIAINVEDLLDGTYHVELQLGDDPDRREQTITLSLQREALWEGKAQ